MKLKLFLIAMVSVCVAGILYAAPLRTIYGTPPVTFPEARNTLLSAVTSPGNGTAVDLGMTVDKHTFNITLSGTNPTSVVVQVKGSNDNSAWFDLVAGTGHTFTVTELVSQGTFDASTNWVKGTGWTIDTSANVTDNATISSLGEASPNMASAYVAGETYVLKFTTTACTSGNITPSVADVSGTAVSTNGAQSQTFTVGNPVDSYGVNFTAAINTRCTVDGIYLSRLNESFHVINKPVRYIKGSYISKAGGSTDTAVTFTATSGGN